MPDPFMAPHRIGDLSSTRPRCSPPRKGAAPGHRSVPPSGGGPLPGPGLRGGRDLPVRGGASILPGPGHEYAPPQGALGHSRVNRHDRPRTARQPGSSSCRGPGSPVGRPGSRGQTCRDVRPGLRVVGTEPVRHPPTAGHGPRRAPRTPLPGQDVPAGHRLPPQPEGSAPVRPNRPSRNEHTGSRARLPLCGSPHSFVSRPPAATCGRRPAPAAPISPGPTRSASVW